MRERQDLHARIPLAVGDCEREPLQHKSAGVVLADWPTHRRFLHQINRAVYFSNKFQSGRLTPLQVPLHGRLQFLKGGGMNLNPLTGHGLPAMEDG
jgi:hypothetical protein